MWDLFGCRKAKPGETGAAQALPRASYGLSAQGGPPSVVPGGVQEEVDIEELFPSC